MTTITDLPPDLLTAIFLKLPPSTLNHLTQITKPFATIIKNPSFISQHFTLFPSKTHQHLLISWENNPPDPSSGSVPSGSNLSIRVREMGTFTLKEEIVSFSYKREDFYYDYKGYVNGLLLFSMQNTTEGKSPCNGSARGSGCTQSYDCLNNNNVIKCDSHVLVLYNPCVRKLKRIPMPPFCYDNDGIGQLSQFGRCEVFLGFDSVEVEHKVVVIYTPYRVSRALVGGGEKSVGSAVAVYDVRRGSWRVREGEEVEVMEDWCFGMKVFVSGVMYWISYDQSGIIAGGYLPTNYTHIVEFDCVRERFRCRTLPGDRSDFAGDLITFPFVVGEDLAVFDVSAWSVSVWVLRRRQCGGSEIGKDDCEWNVWRTNAMDSRTFMFFQMNKYQISNFLYCEKIGIFMFELQGMVKSYDMGTHEMKDLDSSYCHYKMDPYVENLLLLDS